MQKNYHTKCKDSIISFIEQRKDTTFTAADVLSFLNEQNLSVNVTTVYRNIEKLTENGVLIKRKSADNESCEYQTATVDSCHNHIHMQCSSCGKLFHLECDFMHDIAKHLNEHHHFALDCTDSMLKGLCEQCLKGKYDSI